MGFRVGGEILFPIGSVVKLGLGLQYLLPRKMDKDSDVKFYVVEPIYGTVQVNPIAAAKEVFIKGSIGFALIVNDQDDASAQGTVSLGIGAGYEFPFGLILELVYTNYSWTTESSFTNNLYSSKTENDYSWGIFGLNVGYKFKL
ncbi:MAG: hypothetical protein LBV16_03385 [Elusimicrobiota bacterium]|jgi:hypothetical protein|nr:hypothetical protein [Elusimicrobiota bacterium]